MENRGGAVRSSDEVPVMGMEQRDGVRRSNQDTTRERRIF